VPRAAKITGGIVADSVTNAALRDLSIGDGGIQVNSSDVRIDGIETSGEIRFTGASTGSLHGSLTSSSLRILDAAAPEISVNFIGGDIEFSSTGALRLENNAIRGILFVAQVPSAGRAAELLKLNLFSAKKPIQPISATTGQKGATQ
jgi:hypothetical protein